MKIIGAGLSRTGTKSLESALKTLGFRTLHYDRTRLNDILDGTNAHPDFRRYDDLDAVLDLPAAWFFEELLAAYPESRCILTVRDEDSWWESVEAHFNLFFPVISSAEDPFRTQLRNLVYGSVTATESEYRKRYREHNQRVQAVVPPERLLVIDIVGGEGWQTLCPFLGLQPPAAAFPHANARGGLPAIARARLRSIARAGLRAIAPAQKRRDPG